MSPNRPRQNSTKADGEEPGEGGKFEKWSLSGRVRSGGSREGTADRSPSDAPSLGAWRRRPDGRLDHLSRRCRRGRVVPHPAADAPSSARRRARRDLGCESGDVVHPASHHHKQRQERIGGQADAERWRGSAGAADRGSAGEQPAVQRLTGATHQAVPESVAVALADGIAERTPERELARSLNHVPAERVLVRRAGYPVPQASGSTAR